METNDVEEIFKLHEATSDCPVAKNFYTILYSHMCSAVNAMKEDMERVTPETLIKELKGLLGRDAPHKATAFTFREPNAFARLPRPFHRDEKFRQNSL
ncbi:MAG: hypothetical protein LIO57_02275 [Oscillospiraceae bacterium]|nr:hypothetical protein [Oscillospiraceae bacterium]